MTGWTETRLDRVATVNARIGWKALTAAEYQEEGFVFLSTPNIKQPEIDFENVNYISQFRFNESPELKLRVGDVLLAKDGNTLGITNVVAELPRPATVNGSIAVLRPFAMDGRFLRYQLDSAPIQGRIQAFKDGMGVPHLFQRDINRFPLVAPPLAEQRAIADYLDAETARIDALITKKQQLIHLLEDRWVAQRNASILRGVDPVSGTGELPDGWTCPQLGVIIELQRGHDLPAEARRDGPFPVVSSGGVSGYHDESACRGPAVVTGRYGTVGEVYYVEEDCWPLNTTLYVKDFRGNDPRWVALLLESLPLDAESEKSAVGGINRNVIGKLRVPRPGLDEQRRIAAELTRARATEERAREVLERQLKLLAEHRQALITAAVTGAVAVPATA